MWHSSTLQSRTSSCKMYEALLAFWVGTVLEKNVWKVSCSCFLGWAKDIWEHSTKGIFFFWSHFSFICFVAKIRKNPLYKRGIFLLYCTVGRIWFFKNPRILCWFQTLNISSWKLYLVSSLASTATIFSCKLSEAYRFINILRVLAISTLKMETVATLKRR